MYTAHNPPTAHTMAHGGPFGSNGRGGGLLSPEATFRSIELRSDASAAPARAPGGAAAGGVSEMDSRARRGLPPAAPPTVTVSVAEDVTLPVYDHGQYKALGTFQEVRTLPGGTDIILHTPFFGVDGKQHPSMLVGGRATATLMARCGRKGDGVTVVFQQEDGQWLVKD